jgi:hypothetical protein
MRWRRRKAVPVEEIAAALRNNEVLITDPDTGAPLGWIHEDLDGTWNIGRAPRHRAGKPYRHPWEGSDDGAPWRSGGMVR